MDTEKNEFICAFMYPDVNPLKNMKRDNLLGDEMNGCSTSKKIVLDGEEKISPAPLSPGSLDHPDFLVGSLIVKAGCTFYGYGVIQLFPFSFYDDIDVF